MRATRCAQRSSAAASLLEELIGDVARRLFAGDRAFKPRDLLLEQCDALLQLLDRQKRELLPDLVRDLLLRTIVFVVFHVCAPLRRIAPSRRAASRGCPSARAAAALRRGRMAARRDN